MAHSISLVPLRRAEERTALGSDRALGLLRTLFGAHFVAADLVARDGGAGGWSTLRLGFVSDEAPNMLLVASLYGDLDRGIGVEGVEARELDAPIALSLKWEWCVMDEELRIVRVVKEFFDADAIPPSAPLHALLLQLLERLVILGARGTRSAAVSPGA